jgi:hypothetical protein
MLGKPPPPQKKKIREKIVYMLFENLGALIKPWRPQES